MQRGRIMVTEKQCLDVFNAAEKRRLDPLYKPSSDERLSIEAMNNADLSNDSSFNDFMKNRHPNLEQKT